MAYQNSKFSNNFKPFSNQPEPVTEVESEEDAAASATTSPFVIPFDVFEINSRAAAPQAGAAASPARDRCPACDCQCPAAGEDDDGGGGGDIEALGQVRDEEGFGNVTGAGDDEVVEEEEDLLSRRQELDLFLDILDAGGEDGEWEDRNGVVLTQKGNS